MEKAKPKHSTWHRLNALRKNGINKVTLYYTREINGKRVPHYRRIFITAGILAAAAAGIYRYRKHKKHGHVISKAKTSEPTTMM